jgi:hypothetical protein
MAASRNNCALATLNDVHRLPGPSHAGTARRTQLINGDIRPCIRPHIRADTR